MARWIGLLLALLTVAATAQAQSPPPYLSDGDHWTGVREMAALTERTGAEWSVTHEVVLDDLTRERDVLVLLYPTTDLDVGAIATWVERGGALWVMDDFGTSAPLAERFGLTRVEAGPAAAQVDDNPALPILLPTGDHVLTRGVRAVVANHPSALMGPGRPALAFEDGTGLVYDMSLGAGVAVFLSDPSVAINLMIPLQDNARLLSNSVERLCRGASACRLTVVPPGGVVSGAPAPPPETLNERLAALNARLAEMRSPLDRRTSLAISIVLFAGVLVILGAVLPIREPLAEVSRLLPRRPRPKSEFELNLGRYRGAGRESTYALPAAIFRDAFERAFFGRLLGLDASSAATFDDRERAASTFAQRHRSGSRRGRRRAERRVRRFLAELAAIPPTDRCAWGGQPLSARTLRRLHTLGTQLMREADCYDAYTRHLQRPR